MSEQNDDEGPAFSRDGLTLRDYFAAKALPAIIALPMEQMWETYGTNSVSEAAYRQADAMLEERAK